MAYEEKYIASRYLVENELGEGGMSIVYKAKDIITNKEVAIKILKEETLKNPTALERFNREARATASLIHPNIVKVITVGNENGRPYMVNDYIKGRTLRDVLDQRGRLSSQEALDAMKQLCSAVLFAHQNGVLHRDIKPQNVFLTPDGTIKLGDFGIATFMNASHVTRSQAVVGSVHYLAPEIAHGGIATPQSDIYALGITFFELVTGKVPFEADTPVAVCMKQMTEKFPNIKKFNPNVPDAICDVIYKATQKSPLKRYQSVYDMREDIQRIIDHPETLVVKHSFWKRLVSLFKKGN